MKCFEESYQWEKGHSAEDHPSRLTSQHELAVAYQADGQVKKAVELLQYVVVVQEKTLAEDHPFQLTSQHVLAMAYQADGQLKKAVELLEHVVAVEEKTLLKTTLTDWRHSMRSPGRTKQTDMWARCKDINSHSCQFLTVVSDLKRLC